MARTIRLISLNIKDALRRTEWLILKSFYENQTNGYCSIDLLARGANASYPSTRRRALSLEEKGYIVDGTRGILQLSELAETTRSILVNGLREYDNDSENIPTFDNKLHNRNTRRYLDYIVPTELRDYDSSLMTWIKESR